MCLDSFEWYKPHLLYLGLFRKKPEGYCMLGSGDLRVGIELKEFRIKSMGFWNSKSIMKFPRHSHASFECKDVHSLHCTTPGGTILSGQTLLHTCSLILGQDMKEMACNNNNNVKGRKLLKEVYVGLLWPTHCLKKELLKVALTYT